MYMYMYYTVNSVIHAVKIGDFAILTHNYIYAS